MGASLGQRRAGASAFPLCPDHEVGSPVAIGVRNRPDLVPGQAIKLSNPTPELFFNKNAFVRHPRGFGNAGRNIIEGPGFQNIDLSLSKNTPIREGINLQFRAEAFNVFNHPNFNQPNRTQNSADFGRITTTRTVRGDLGSSRQIQLGMKLTF